MSVQDDPHWGGTLGGILVDAVGRCSVRSAIADDSIRWTYGELADAIGRFIALYKSAGLKKGSGLSVCRPIVAESWTAYVRP
jgi:fatty-acyl-CoA synthase